MTTITRTFEVQPIEPAVVAELLECDDAGRSPRIVTAHAGGSPLRCCLRLSRPNEPVALVSYAPVRRWAQDRQADPGPYDELGPVFVHPEPCEGTTSRDLPEELLGSPRVLRMYDATGAICGGRLVATNEDQRLIVEELFADPEVAVIHARAVEYGCFTYEVRRANIAR